MSDLDLSGFGDIVLIFNTVLQALLPVILIGAFIAFVIVLAGGGKWLKKLSSNAVGMEAVPNPKRARKMKIAIAGFFLLIAMSITMMPAMAAPAAATLNVGVTSVMANTPLTVEAQNLDASTAYAIYWGSTAILNWTSSASPVDRIVTFEATPPASGNTVILYLYSAATTVDSTTFYISEAGDFLPTGFFIALGVALMIIGIFVMIVAGFVKKRR